MPPSPPRGHRGGEVASDLNLLRDYGGAFSAQGRGLPDRCLSLFIIPGRGGVAADFLAPCPSWSFAVRSLPVTVEAWGELEDR